MEATILFPIIIMVFAALVLLTMYLPTRGLLQRSTQEAATAITTTKSDTWLTYSTTGMNYAFVPSKNQLPNVYASLIHGITGKGSDDQSMAQKIVKYYDSQSMLKLPGSLKVEYSMTNYVIYKEVTVTATRSMPMPVNLSFVGFPETLDITVSSTAVVTDGDEFIRSLDLAGDFINDICKKYGIADSEIFKAIKDVGDKITGFLGI